MRWLLALAILTTTAPASADWVEGGLQLGVIDRRLGNTNFRTTMNAQIYADVSVIPGYFTVGGYFNGWPTGYQADPERLSADQVDIYIGGVRAKGLYPLTKRLSPYVTGGIGWANADFPAARGTVCAPTCEERTAPASTVHYVDVPLGVGLRINLEGPFVFTAEGLYRVVLGYSNEAYERTLHPTAGTGGRALSFVVSMGVAF
jgi:hypothetical protein